MEQIKTKAERAEALVTLVRETIRPEIWKENGGTAARQTFLLVANPSTQPASVRITLLFDDGPSTPMTFAVAAGARLTVPASVAFPASVGRGFGAVVESIGASPPPIVAERAIYADFGGTVWAAGSDQLGTPLP